MIKAFMFGTKTNEKPAFNHKTNEEEYITKVAMRILSPKADAIPYEHKEVYIYSEAEHLAKQLENPHKGIQSLSESFKTMSTVVMDISKEIDDIKDSLEETKIEEG